MLEDRGWFWKQGGNGRLLHSGLSLAADLQAHLYTGRCRLVPANGAHLLPTPSWAWASLLWPVLLLATFLCEALNSHGLILNVLILPLYMTYVLAGYGILGSKHFSITILKALLHYLLPSSIAIETKPFWFLVLFLWVQSGDRTTEWFK